MADPEGGYNGWTNYETWNVALWLDNDQGSYEYWRLQAREVYRAASADSSFTRAERAALDLRETLKDEIVENNPLADQANLYHDLLGAALDSVNWYEITRHWIDEIAAAVDAEVEPEPK